MNTFSPFHSPLSSYSQRRLKAPAGIRVSLLTWGINNTTRASTDRANSLVGLKLLRTSIPISIKQLVIGIKFLGANLLCTFLNPKHIT